MYDIYQQSALTNQPQSDGSYYTFSNIPYAQQPVGALRFQKPVVPIGKSSKVNDGNQTGVMCMQAYPEWILELQASGYGVNVSTVAEMLYDAEGQTESCLLLDVYAPKDIFLKGSQAEGRLRL
jgi:carboxylesterase type B